MIITKTPVRISFFGGGTDYPNYYHKYQGAVLGTTINKYIYISLNELSEFFDYKYRIGYSKSETVSAIDEIKHPSVRECLKHYQIPNGLDIHIFADLPARTGLGSSSAFTVGLIKALETYLEIEHTPEDLAKKALYVEQTLIKEKVGSQDQCHAAFGGLNLFEFDSEGFKAQSMDVDPDKIKLLSDSSLLFFTGIKRYAEDILDEQVLKTKTSSNDLHLEKMYDMVFEAKRMLYTKEEDDLLSNWGGLLHESWVHKCKLSNKISNDTVDTWYEKARAAGAYGGKLCGAGHGGFLLLLAPKERHASIREALKPLKEVDFDFEPSGSTIIYNTIEMKRELQHV